MVTGLVELERLRSNFSEFALKVKEKFNLDSVRLVAYGNQDKLINRVAICGGSGQSFYREAMAKGAQVYITGDIYYHGSRNDYKWHACYWSWAYDEVLMVDKLLEKFNGKMTIIGQ